MDYGKHNFDLKTIKVLESLEQYVERCQEKPKECILKVHNSNLNHLNVLEKCGFVFSADSRHKKWSLNNLTYRSTSRKTAKSSNSLGRLFTDAVELTTILSLTNDIKYPIDTKQKLFIENPQYFISWHNTFQQTRPAVKKIVGNISQFEIIHNATDTSEMKKIIKKIVKKCKLYISSKDVWCPADIFMIKKSEKSRIFKEFNKIIDDFDGENMLKQINVAIWNEYKNKNFYPISLKQITEKQAKIEYTNELTNQSNIPTYDIEIEKFIVDMTAETKEIGSFIFKNKTTNKNIRIQIKTFPFEFRTVQAEIVEDGSKTGGRIGKIPVGVIDRVMSKFGHKRISSIDYFGSDGKNGFFTNFDNRLIKEYYEMYRKVIKHPKVSSPKKLSLQEFSDLIDLGKRDEYAAACMANKIGALIFDHFFLENEKDISYILTEFINGAERIGKHNAFFIKIY